MSHPTYQLFKAVKVATSGNSETTTHLDSCQYLTSDIPIDACPCDCHEFYWFIQGLHMTDAECRVRLLQMQSTVDTEIVEKSFRTKRIGQEDWSEWNELE